MKALNLANKHLSLPWGLISEEVNLRKPKAVYLTHCLVVLRST